MSDESPDRGDPEQEVPEPRPGPDALYGPNPTPPQLANGPDWNATPLMVAGTDAYQAGEYLYQDYVYDDHGADTRSVLERPPDGDTLGGFYSRPTGDYRYPDDGETYGYNAADLLEFRAQPTDTGVRYRITLNTMLEPDTTAVAIGIHTDPSEASDDAGGDDADAGEEETPRTDWGYGLGELGAPVDHTLVTWGTGAELDGTPLDDDHVTVDLERNQIDIEIPLDPHHDTWRHYAITGLWNHEDERFQAIAVDADDETPGGGVDDREVPPVFNVAFRFDEPMGRNVDLDTLLPRLATLLVNAPADLLGELNDPLGVFDRLDDVPNLLSGLDDPLGLLDPLDDPLDPLGSPSLTELLSEIDRFWLFSDTPGVPRVLGVGNWHEHAQATALADRDISRFHADVDFGKLHDDTTERNVPDSGYLTYLYPSRYDLGEGVDPFENVLRGRIQPYTVYVPEDLEEPAPMVAMLHSLGNCYTQYPVWMPQYVERIAETCNAVTLLPQTRGPGIWYKREAELDVFEAWRDLETRIEVDRTEVSVTGYSMGGYGAIMLATKHPDLFGRCFPIVGPPAEDPLEAPTNNLLATPSLLMHELLGGEGGGELFSIFNERPENALRLTENLRHTPMLLWHGGADPLVPVLGPTNYASRLRSHGYRHQIDVFPAADHMFLAFRDRWDRGPEYLAETEVPRSPARVTYRHIPEFNYPDLGLVHDGAYWVTDMEPRDDESSGLVDVVSLADGYGEPIPESYTSTGTRPLPYTATGIRWNDPDDERPPANALDVSLEGLASVTLWIEAAGLDPGRELTIHAESDEATTVRLAGSFGTHEVTVEPDESTLVVPPVE